jgi:hypothetical protein
MPEIVAMLLGLGCFFFFLEMTTGPWKWLDRLTGWDDHPDEKEINAICLRLLLEQEDLSINIQNRVVCNECKRESCGFCTNGRVIRQAQELLDKRSEL